MCPIIYLLLKIWLLNVKFLTFRFYWRCKKFPVIKWNKWLTILYFDTVEAFQWQTERRMWRPAVKMSLFLLTLISIIDPLLFPIWINANVLLERKPIFVIKKVSKVRKHSFARNQKWFTESSGKGLMRRRLICELVT